MLNILFETGKLGVKSCNFPMAPSIHLTRESEAFEDPEKYRRLVGKLNYLLVTDPDIAHSVSAVQKSNKDNKSVASPSAPRQVT